MNIRKILTICLVGASLCSCNDLLTEEPEDFLSPENSYTDKEGIEAAVNFLYLDIRTQFYAPTSDSWIPYTMLGVDVDLWCQQYDNDKYNSYFYWNTANADMGNAKVWWSNCYSTIFKCNVIINRSQNPDIRWSEEEKNLCIAEAKFVRAFYYRLLGNMWGTAPLIVEEEEPRFNYTNSTPEAIFKQCKEDLEFAITYLPDVDKQIGGKASKQAAHHLMSEVCLSMKDYQGAVEHASQVINHPGMELMKDRFGKYVDFEFEGWDYQGEKQPWGDVYFDLFREGNFNRVEGNKECIWNIQMDPYIEGGGHVGKQVYCSFERWLTTCYTATTKDGKMNFMQDVLGGRAAGGNSPTPYAADYIWEFKGDFDRDIRNSTYNVQREWYITNPESEYYGQIFTPENIGLMSWYFRVTQPGFKKFVPVKHYGFGWDVVSQCAHDGGFVYKDWYIMRLAETYLLRAEAYMNLNKKTEAAADINAVRLRAHATPVDPSEVNIDLILDERARELYGEEFRLNTLMRLNKLAEYVMKYNPLAKKEGWQLPDYLNKFPIPNSEIEANKEGGLVQNPGY